MDGEYHEAIGRDGELRRASEAIAAELASLEQRTSNLPAEQVEIRAELCAALGLTPEDLPYAGELLDVHDEHSQWRGAAERVLRGFALSLLVPQQHYDAVAGWVNGRRLTVAGRGGRQVGARLVYERVARQRVRLQPAEPGALLLADCIDVKDGPFRDYLADELTKRADYRCAASLEEFRGQRRAVTREGQVRSGDRHEKDDRHRVDDPRRWVLGWANERKIVALRTELAELEDRRAVVAAELADLGAQRDALQARAESLARLESFPSWDDLDVEEASTRADEYDAERERLAAGSSRLEEITRALVRNTERAAAVTAEIERLTGRLATTAAAAQRAERDKSADDEFLAAQGEVELATARAAYPALDARLGAKRPTLAAQ